MKDARWRLVLQWGTVITFLAMPLTIFLLAFFNRDYEEHIRNFKFLGKFFESITALVFGLAGLRSVDKYVETKNGNGSSKPKNPES